MCEYRFICLLGQEALLRKGMNFRAITITMKAIEKQKKSQIDGLIREFNCRSDFEYFKSCLLSPGKVGISSHPGKARKETEDFLNRFIHDRQKGWPVR